MTALSPSRRLKTKTTDFTDFFRNGGLSSSQRGDNDASTSSYGNLDVPQSDTEGGTKKKITRIPLFGRSRKKSNQSSASSPYAVANGIRESSDVGEMSSRAATPSERRPSEPSLNGVPPPLPTKSLSSKFAAHFSHSRTSKVVIPTSSSSTPNPGGLQPPTPRSPSFDSKSSKGSKARSTTPRPSRPTITVSLTPDSLDEYKDLFTTAEDNAENTGSVRSTAQHRSRIPNGHATPTSSSTPTPRTGTPEQRTTRPRHTPAAALAAAVRDRQAAIMSHERTPSVSSSSKNSGSRQNSESDKSNERAEGRFTQRPTRESPRPIIFDKEKGTPQSHQRRPSNASHSDHQPSSIRSRMKQPSATPARSRPPTMPLPLPPPSSTPTPPPDLPTPTLHTPVPEIGQPSEKIRSRTNTVASIPDSPISVTSRPKASDSPQPTALVDVIPAAESEPLDIDNASVEQLRMALRNRNKHVEDLAAFILRKEEEWALERRVLEKKVSSLQRDIVRRDSEITGLKLIINDEEGVVQQRKPTPSSRLAVSSAPPDSDQDQPANRRISAPRRLVAYQSDSGAESHAESLRSSMSGAESVGRAKKMYRASGLGEFAMGLSPRRSKLSPVVPGKGGSESKRSSFVSTSSASPSSSTSSLLPPSPSITMSSLSAIPEGTPPSAYLRSLRTDDEERQRAARRVSTSSMTSSSTAASSSAYSTNIKRSRPPSIAQVLEKSPNMDDVLEKLRPFA